MDKKAVIFLNGDRPSTESIEKIEFEKAFVICADGAFSYAKNFCNPDMVVGDFDSLSETVENAECLKFPVKKDFTDSQIAVKVAVEKGNRLIDIYGAFGGRVDHEQVNYSLLALADSIGGVAVLRGGDFDVFFLKDTLPFIGKTKIGKRVSLVPYSDEVHILYTKGLMFAAEDVSVNKIDVFTTSNEAVSEEIEYRLSEGTALLFVEN